MLKTEWNSYLKDTDLRHILVKYLYFSKVRLSFISVWVSTVFPMVLKDEEETIFGANFTLRNFPTWYKASHKAARDEYLRTCDRAKNMGKDHPDLGETLVKVHDAVKVLVTLAEVSAIIETYVKKADANILLKHIVEQSHIFVKLSMKQQDIIKRNAQQIILPILFNDSGKITKKMQSIIDQLKERDDKRLNAFRRKIPAIKRDIERHTNCIPSAFRRFGAPGASIHVGQLKHKNCCGEVGKVLLATW